MISVHGRTRCQLTPGLALEIIREVKEGVRIPVIANGDSLTRRTPTGIRGIRADGLMIGRGCYGRPWFVIR